MPHVGDGRPDRPGGPVRQQRAGRHHPGAQRGQRVGQVLHRGGLDQAEHDHRRAAHRLNRADENRQRLEFQSYQRQPGLRTLRLRKIFDDVFGPAARPLVPRGRRRRCGLQRASSTSTAPGGSRWGTQGTTAPSRTRTTSCWSAPGKCWEPPAPASSSTARSTICGSSTLRCPMPGSPSCTTAPRFWTCASTRRTARPGSPTTPRTTGRGPARERPVR